MSPEAVFSIPLLEEEEERPGPNDFSGKLCGTKMGDKKMRGKDLNTRMGKWKLSCFSRLPHRRFFIQHCEKYTTWAASKPNCRLWPSFLPVLLLGSSPWPHSIYLALGHESKTQSIILVSQTKQNVYWLSNINEERFLAGVKYMLQNAVLAVSCTLDHSMNKW